MDRKSIRTWGFRTFLAGFIALILSIPLPGFIWIPGFWHQPDSEFLNFFLLPCIGFGLVVLSFVLLSIGSRQGSGD